LPEQNAEGRALARAVVTEEAKISPFDIERQAVERASLESFGQVLQLNHARNISGERR
jgi:hypothetical protein